MLAGALFHYPLSAVHYPLPHASVRVSFITSGMPRTARITRARCRRSCTSNSKISVEVSLSRSTTDTRSMLVCVPAIADGDLREHAHAVRHLDLDLDVEHCGPPPACQVTEIHFSGCLRNVDRLPQASRWITTPRPADRLARIGSFGIGKQQRA